MYGKKKLSKFSRVEYKYLLSERQYNALMPIILRHTRADEYGKSTIMNLYFDTPDYRLIRASIEKPVYKEKLRLRSYGIPSDDSTVFLELKKKYQKVVYKRREQAPYREMVEYINGKRPVKDSQIFKEINYFLSFYKELAPRMFISYEREAYFDKEAQSLRISFDSNITYRDYDLDLQKGVYGQRLLEKGGHLMEIKAIGALPLWLAEALSENEIYKISFSKYGNAYKNILLKGALKCSTV